ncbi:helix-turn-helix domain-containing protein [Actinotignum sp. GS-2025a]|uniref:helix-turn-helix domain-containing protein n=1 Tax=Actinotignum sp. GS-2025a TaxID=3427274 RepID=UPI003F458ADA
MGLLTSVEFAEVIGVSRASVWNWCRSGRISAVQLPGGQWRIPKSELDRILAPVSKTDSPTTTKDASTEVPGQLEIFG